MTESRPFPFYHKLCLNLLTIVLLCAIIYIGSDILMPLFLCDRACYTVAAC